MEIKLKEGIDIDALNTNLKERGMSNQFISRMDTQSWLDDINNNPDSNQKHLKPVDRDLTLDELKEMFPKWTETGLFETDLYFGRTSEDEMERIAGFIVDHQYDIQYITDVETLIDRGGIKPAMASVLHLLEKPEEVHEEYPKEEQLKQRKLQSGQLLCKSWGTEPFWVIYGKVERPQFLKERKYIEEGLNSLYRDDQKRGYLLIPLYDFSYGFFEKVYKEAWERGLREHPNYFLTCCYSVEIQNIKNAAQSFFEFYTEEELVERFQLIKAQILHNADLFHFDVTWKVTGIAVNTKKIPQKELVPLANALYQALKKYRTSKKRA